MKEDLINYTLAIIAGLLIIVACVYYRYAVLAEYDSDCVLSKDPKMCVVIKKGINNE